MSTQIPSFIKAKKGMCCILQNSVSIVDHFTYWSNSIFLSQGVVTFSVAWQIFSGEMQSRLGISSGKEMI